MSHRLEQLSKYNIILASKSPRRHHLISGLGIDFEIRTKEVDESFDESLKAAEIPEFLAQKKASAFQDSLSENDLLITADTVVWINGHALNKPENREEAVSMLQEISGCTHEVFTGVCLTTMNKQLVFSEGTRVEFNPLTRGEIDHYLDRYKPFDKAGAYGIQEFIGYIGIKRIDGDFYNVVGFPVQRFWRELANFLP